MRHILLCSLLCAGSAVAQTAISARSGLINYVEGQVLLDGKQVESKPGTVLPQMKENGQIRTEEGRAEILLTPGVFLRMAEHSSLRMVTNRLIDTRLELLSGSIMVEVGELLKDNNVTLVYNEAAVTPRKPGLYRLDSQQARVRVYDGEALVDVAKQSLPLRKGKELILNSVLVAEKFDTKTGDSLYRWTRRRAEYLAMANISAAKSIRDRGMSWNTNGWFFNPYYGMYTYIPYRGYYNSFWGYRFWSPQEVYAVYFPPSQSAVNAPNYNANLGYSTVSHTSAGTSGTMATAASAPTTATSAPTASIPRESSNAGGRGK